MGIADQLVEFAPQYRNVFSNLLGRVVVMEHLDAAIAVARKYGYRFRIVTLDGQVLNPGGLDDRRQRQPQRRYSQPG